MLPEAEAKVPSPSGHGRTQARPWRGNGRDLVPRSPGVMPASGSGDGSSPEGLRAELEGQPALRLEARPAATRGHGQWPVTRPPESQVQRGSPRTGDPRSSRLSLSPGGGHAWGTGGGTGDAAAAWPRSWGAVGTQGSPRPQGPLGLGSMTFSPGRGARSDWEVAGGLAKGCSTSRPLSEEQDPSFLGM